MNAVLSMFEYISLLRHMRKNVKSKNLALHAKKKNNRRTEKR